MELFAPPVERLIEEFAKLPGIGQKTAQRLAFHVLDLPKEDAERFADAIREAKAKTFTCRRCQNLTDSEICPICSDKTRNQKVICVVAEPRDVIAFERTKEYKGLYHVLHGLISQAAEDMRFHMEHRISHEMQREDRMTGLPNRRAFEEYMERVRTGEAGCLDAVLTYIRLEGLNERNDRFGLQAGDEAVIAAARCVSDFCRECEDEGESVLCFRTGGNEFALIRPEPHIDSGQLHRQFRAVVARYNRTCAPRARITMTFGFSRLCDEDGKSRSISAWKAEADAHLKRNEARLGGDAE